MVDTGRPVSLLISWIPHHPLFMREHAEDGDIVRPVTVRGVFVLRPPDTMFSFN